MIQLKNILEGLEENFRISSNSENGLTMSKYMRDRFPFYGIKATNRKELARVWMSQIPKELPNEQRWELIEEMWSKEQREFQYVAIDWMNSWNKKYISESDSSKLRWLISNKSWWDSVDSIAGNYLGKYCQKFPNEAKHLIQEWRDSDNMWLQRSCLIFQLKYGKEVDFELLKSLIKQFQGNKEFFIQKAIGWSLRQYSKFNLLAVQDFVKEINLQGLALREASKYL